jgi:hypothetical protein
VALEDEWEALAATELPDFPQLDSGVDLALLAADTADCVSVFLATGSLDPERRGTLRACEAELRAALPGLSGPPADYLSRLAELAGGVLYRVDRNRPSWLG